MVTESVLNNSAPHCINSSNCDNVLSIQMNRSDKLNGWTLPMIETIKDVLVKVA